jgi:hypothetical protein
MESRMPTLCLTIASLSVLPAGSALVAQSGPANTMHACDLVSNADVEKVTGRRLQDPPGRLSTVQKTQSACDFWEAAVQIALFSSRLSQEYVNRAVDGNGFDRTKHAVAGVGDSASIYFTPKGKDPEGFLVAYAGGPYDDRAGEDGTGSALKVSRAPRNRAGEARGGQAPVTAVHTRSKGELSCVLREASPSSPRACSWVMVQAANCRLRLRSPRTPLGRWPRIQPAPC